MTTSLSGAIKSRNPSPSDMRGPITRQERICIIKKACPLRRSGRTRSNRKNVFNQRIYRMRKTVSSLTAVLFICNASIGGTIDSLYEVATWSKFHDAAISYTFDDNCANQLALAVPMFNNYGFTLTLFTVTDWGPTGPASGTRLCGATKSPTIRLPMRVLGD
jgi:hypothetical protein